MSIKVGRSHGNGYHDSVVRKITVKFSKSFFLKKKKTTYLIIGVLLEPTSDLILGRIALFIENVIRKEGMKHDNLDRTQKMIIRDHMKGFTKLIEQFLFHDEDWILLKLIDERIVEITRN